MIANPIISRR